MDKNQEEFALLLAEKTIRNKMHALLDLNSINEVFPPNAEGAYTMINSGEYKLDYVFISFDYEDFEKLIYELKKLNNVNSLKKLPHIALIGIYDKSKHLEERVEEAKNLGLEFFIEKSSLNIKSISDIVLKSKEARTNKMSSEDKKKERYTYLRNLGSGEFGVVDLYKDNETNKYVAVKKISLEGMSQAGKNKVKQEVDYMNSVKTPTIIEFYSSTVENDVRYIYLEFAKEGTLEQRIRDYKLKGESFKFETLLDWLIEILIAIFSLNKNNMMHRDIKSENMLLTEDGICKLSDLGISRIVDEQQKTLCGTPYYVSPEIASGLDYDYNSDIWSLGIVLYEIITGIKPFDKPNPSELYQSIINDDYKSLPVDTDSRLVFLVNFMLKKNPQKRASLVDLLKQEFIYNRMILLIEKFNWKDKIPNVDDLLSYGKKLEISYDYFKLLSEDDKQSIKNVIKIFDECTYTPFKKSLLSAKIINAVNGDSIYNSLIDNLAEFNITKIKPNINQSENDEEEIDYLNTLLEKGLLIPLSDIGDGFKETANHYYVFSFDDIYNEMNVSNFRILKNLKASANMDLLSLSIFVLSEGISIFDKITNDNNNKSDILSLDSHLNFICAISLFADFKIMDLSVEERVITLLNVYQIMLIHNLLNIYNEKNKSNGDGLLSYFKNKVAINYAFKDIILSNLDIKHVVLRNNKKPPNNYVRLASTGDFKTLILPEYNDLRPILMLYDLNEENLNDCRFKFQIFDKKDFDNQLNEIVVNFITYFVSFSEDSIIIPSFISQYIPDFGTQVDFIKHIYKIYIANNKKHTIFKVKTPKEHEFDFLSNISLLLRKINSKQISIVIGD